MDDYAYAAALARFGVAEEILAGYGACPFKVGDRVKDDIFENGTVSRLSSHPEYTGPGGQVDDSAQRGARARRAYGAYTAAYQQVGGNMPSPERGIRNKHIWGVKRAYLA